jgi:hypothetical protein
MMLALNGPSLDRDATIANEQVPPAGKVGGQLFDEIENEPALVPVMLVKDKVGEVELPELVKVKLTGALGDAALVIENVFPTPGLILRLTGTPAFTIISGEQPLRVRWP